MIISKKRQYQDSASIRVVGDDDEGRNSFLQAGNITLKHVDIALDADNGTGERANFLVHLGVRARNGPYLTHTLPSPLHHQ